MSNKKYIPLGKVLHVVENKEAIVRLESKKIPKKGILVVNQEMKVIGRTTDPFGPTKSPYIGIVFENRDRAPKPGETVLGITTSHKNPKKRTPKPFNKSKSGNWRKKRPNKK